MQKLHSILSRLPGSAYLKLLKQKINHANNVQQRLRCYTSLIKPGDLVFDVGANLGSYSQVYLELGASVVAVEPQKECARTLFLRYGANPAFHLVNKALGAGAGQQEMFIGNSHVISSLSSAWVEKIEAENLFPRQKWEQKVMVQVTTLDALIAEFGKPDYIKIDAEAYEFEILSGLTQPVRLISFEFHPAFLEPAVQSIHYLARFGNLQFNYMTGEEFSWVFKQWVSAQEMLSELERTKAVPNLYYGDIYVRIG